jgi:uncharacterized membrane protein
VLAAFLIAAGTSHFVKPTFFDSMIPRRLPGTPRMWTLGSGVAEAAIGLAVAIPRTRRHGALAAAVLFIAVLPGNGTELLHAHREHRLLAEQVARTLRIPAQAPFVIWALRVRKNDDLAR